MTEEWPIGTSDTSDGYHTSGELYYYRMLYNALAFNLLDISRPTVDAHKSWRHSNGERCFGGGWFVVVAQLPTGQVTNHYEEKHWNLFAIPERDKAADYDEHTPQEAAERLEAFLRTMGAVRRVFLPGYVAEHASSHSRPQQRNPEKD